MSSREPGLYCFSSIHFKISDLTKRTFDFCYYSPEHFSEWFRRYYGPITRLAGTLDEQARAQFAADLADVARHFSGQGNGTGNGTVLAPGEYLEAVGVRR